MWLTAKVSKIKNGRMKEKDKRGWGTEKGILKGNN